MKKSKEQIKKEKHLQHTLRTFENILNIITDNGKKPLVIVEKGGEEVCNN